jgi:hypothetical protein
MELLSDKTHINEQEMDFLILEELVCSPPFAKWFLGQAGYPDAQPGSIRRLDRSVSTWDGETDLLLVHRTQAGNRALLIENKVGAAFTKLQPERYRIRGEAGQAEGKWTAFSIVLIAPQVYIAGIHTTAFDFTITYEAMRDQLELSADAARTAFKVWLLDLAINKAKGPWVKTVSPEITAFFKAFRDFARPRLPEVTWPTESVPRAPTSTWVVLRVPPFSSNVLIEMKPANGVVDLRLYGVPEGRLITALKVVPAGADTVPAAKSSAIRMQTPQMHPRAAFAGQEEQAEACLSAVRLLWEFAHEQKAAIFQLTGGDAAHAPAAPEVDPAQGAEDALRQASHDRFYSGDDVSFTKLTSAIPIATTSPPPAQDTNDLPP